jgi:1-acyl-sn-glycerol-3-phosphate acyltransferase
MLGYSASERAVYLFGCGLARLVYRVKAIGLENLPSGGFLLVPNHITWVDAIILQLACPRPVRFVIDEEFYRKPVLHRLCEWSAPFRSTAVNRAKRFGVPPSKSKPARLFVFSRKANFLARAHWDGCSADMK